MNTYQVESSRIKVDVIEEQELNENKSSPKGVLDRAMKYIEANVLEAEDQLWFVIDVDRWKEQQIRELADHCKQEENWNIVISNPCFEVWLYFHKRKRKFKPTPNECKAWKQKVDTLQSGGYYYLDFLLLIQDAIVNAGSADSSPDHFFPKPSETKVYQLAQAIIKKVSTKEFDKFLSKTIPQLIEREKAHIRIKKGHK